MNGFFRCCSKTENLNTDLIQVRVISSLGQFEFIPFVITKTSQNTVEYMIIPFFFRLHERRVTFLMPKERVVLTWETIRIFSKRYWSTKALAIAPVLSKLTVMYFPNRLLLSLRIVLALPKAATNKNQQLNSWNFLLLPSIMGLASIICCSMLEFFLIPLIAARHCRICFVDSVLPAPDSPLNSFTWKPIPSLRRTIYLMMIHWLHLAFWSVRSRSIFW